MVMESFEDSNCHSLSDSFSLYERYLRSFKVVDNFIDENNHREPSEATSSTNGSSNGAINIDLSGAIHTTLQSKHCEIVEDNLYLVAHDGVVDKGSTSLDTDSSAKVESECPSFAALLDISPATVERSVLTDKSDPIDVPVSSEESKQGFKQPVFITSTMENSNNAVDSVPMFHEIRHTGSIFKLPISELSFNGTIKHVQKLKPIVDPISAMSSASKSLALDHKPDSQCRDISLNTSDNSGSSSTQTNSSAQKVSNLNIRTSNENRRENLSESTGDSQYEEFNPRKEYQPLTDRETSGAKWNAESSASFEASFDSGVRSPDIFSEDDDIDTEPVPSEQFWNFVKDYEVHDKKMIKKMEEKLLGILPPPSVTILKIDVAEMLKKYYCFLPVFTGEVKIGTEKYAVTPSKGVSLVEIPTQSVISDLQESFDAPLKFNNKYVHCSPSKESTRTNNTSVNDNSIVLKMSSEVEAKETPWPELLKCRYYDIHYNLTKHSEKIELLAQRIGERFVGAETETSVCIYSGGLQSPSSASKRKALRLKMAQANSPGRRLSHLARRRQTFCNAATFNEKLQQSTSKLVLIDKKYLPHKKLINVAERKRRTPGKKTPGKKTPHKLTPIKTPKTKSGSSSRKKVMRRLLMDPDNMTQSQSTQDTLKRALFISPENRKVVPTSSSSSQAMKSRRALFGSPVTAETKSMDGTQSDTFLKRKRDALDDEPETSRSKIAKSLSFGGDNIHNSQPFSASQPINRRASDVVVTKTKAELNEIHKKKLLWSVSEALRVHGWRMSSPGFREKAAALAQLTRRLLALPSHAAKLASPKLSTSDTMLKIARRYVFSIIQGRTVEECYQEEQTRLANVTSTKLTGYISATAYQQWKARQTASTSTIKENTCNNCTVKQDQPKSASKNILQDKLVNIDSNSNSSSSSGLSAMDRMGIYKTNSMPSFEEAARMRARRQISFDNVDFARR